MINHYKSTISTMISTIISTISRWISHISLQLFTGGLAGPAGWQVDFWESHPLYLRADHMTELWESKQDLTLNHKCFPGVPKQEHHGQQWAILITWNNKARLPW